MMKFKMSMIIFLIISLIMFSVAQAQPMVVQPYAEKFTIENCINTFSMDKAVKTPAGYQYWFVPQNFLDDGQTVKMSVVGPNGAMHPPHKHSGDEIFFILEGTAKFFLNGKTTTGGAYTSFYCPEGSEHGISNAGNKELKYLVIRKYPKTN
jgi:quercetin dioxygenase-like cupin family protein